MHAYFGDKGGAKKLKKLLAMGKARKMAKKTPHNRRSALDIIRDKRSGM